MRSLLTTDEAAELLGVRPKTLTRWRWTGDGPRFKRIGPKAIRYDPRDLEEFIAAGDRASTSDPGPQPHQAA